MFNFNTSPSSAFIWRPVCNDPTQVGLPAARYWILLLSLTLLPPFPSPVTLRSPGCNTPTQAGLPAYNALSEAGRNVKEFLNAVHVPRN